MRRSLPAASRVLCFFFFFFLPLPLVKKDFTNGCPDPAGVYTVHYYEYDDLVTGQPEHKIRPVAMRETAAAALSTCKKESVA